VHEPTARLAERLAAVAEELIAGHEERSRAVAELLTQARLAAAKADETVRHLELALAVEGNSPRRLRKAVVAYRRGQRFPGPHCITEARLADSEMKETTSTAGLRTFQCPAGHLLELAAA
jgi:hypothetical protein